MRTCSRCHGHGKLSDDLGGDIGFGSYHRSQFIFQEVCPDCKGRGLVQPGIESRIKTRAEDLIFGEDTDDWDLTDWEWDARMEAFEKRHHEFARKGEKGAHTGRSAIDTALALRRMTEANGATPAEAATALRLMGRLLAKNGLTISDLDEREKSRA